MTSVAQEVATFVLIGSHIVALLHCLYTPIITMSYVFLCSYLLFQHCAMLSVSPCSKYTQTHKYRIM